MKKIKKYFILTPPNHRIINPLNAINIDVPRSGWASTKIIGITIIDMEIVILVKEFTSSIFNLWKYFARHNITPIFISSEG